MSELDLKERRPTEGSGQAATASIRPNDTTRRGHLGKAVQHLSSLISTAGGALIGHEGRAQTPASRDQHTGEAPSVQKTKEISSNVSKPAPNGKDRFRLLSLKELEDLPDPEWMIEDILPQNGLAVLFGEPGAAKSFLALDWAMSLASGRSWYGLQVKKGPVVYVYAEGASGLKHRVQAWCIARGAEPDCFRFLPRPLNVLNRDEVDRLIKAIRKQAVAPNLIVIDTLARCFGNGDENSPKDMNAFVANADALRLAFPGATVLVVHHSGKDASKGDRGHSALRAAADTIIQLSKRRKQLKLTCKKQKDAQEFEEEHYWLRPVDLGNGNSSCVIDKASAPSCGKKPNTNALKTDEKALEALIPFGPEGASFSDWHEASGLPKSTFKDARKRLLKGWQVFDHENGRYFATHVGPGAGSGPDQGCPTAA